jgi:nicotinate dehydrogenase subunit A
MVPVSSVAGRRVTTIEGLGTPGTPDPLQTAFIAEQAAQCGYCYNGQIIKGAELLFKTPQPTEAQIRSAMDGHICRCGTYPRIVAAIQRAARDMAPKQTLAAPKRTAEEQPPEVTRV